MQTQDRPVFRQDLVAEAIEEGGAKFIDVADPDTGNIFRFFEVEYALACAMDGQRDVAGIVKWAQEELGLTPSPKEVQSVIATLVDLRFVDTGATRLSDVPEAKGAARHGVAADAEATVVGGAPLPDDELAPGIVVAKGGKAASPSIDVELGQSGASSGAGARAEAPLPKADFDLGAPGASTGAKAPKPPVEDIALGAPGVTAKAAAKSAASDMSMDLSSEMPVKAADVKEAVRASKVMTAVEVPKELQDELDGKAPAKPAAAAAKASDKAAEKAPAKTAEKPADKAAEKATAVAAKAPDKAAEKKTDKAAEKKTDKAADKAADKKADKAADKPGAKKPAVELKQVPEKQPIAPPAPAPKVSPVLVILLILVVVGAGGFFFWKMVLDKPDGGGSEQTQKQPTPPPAPPPPAEVTSKVAMETPAAQDVKAPAGAIETLEAADKDVKSGDVLVTMTGAKQLTTDIAKLQADVDKAQPTIEAAQKELADAQQKENNAAGVAAAQKKLDAAKKPLDDKKAQIAKKQGDLDKLTLKAQTDGKLALAPEAKVGAKTTADQLIAKVVRATVPTATFKLPPNTKIGADGNLSLDAGGKTVICTVSDAQAETIKVTCPADSGLADGAAVKFKLPK